jgi:hypothetical protein
MPALALHRVDIAAVALTIDKPDHGYQKQREYDNPIKLYLICPDFIKWLDFQAWAVTNPDQAVGFVVIIGQMAKYLRTILKNGKQDHTDAPVSR